MKGNQDNPITGSTFLLRRLKIITSNKFRKFIVLPVIINVITLSVILAIVGFSLWNYLSNILTNETSYIYFIIHWFPSWLTLDLTWLFWLIFILTIWLAISSVAVAGGTDLWEKD